MAAPKPLAALAGMLGSEKVLNLIIRWSDLILAIFLMAIIAIIIIPLTPVVMDVLIAGNLTLSISLLLIALYIPSAVHLSMFPSLLLITTMYRLGIAISATKLILLYAHAGNIIYAFGAIVVGGNFVVGAVVFLIITLVQFIVVTKGAERVAEVAARFRLDAMPGKQMAIDADLRAGIIDAAAAREKRAAIGRESELYGAMDGAMKFVKGDAIAGIVIVIINIVGGLVIGMMQHGMTLMQAVQTYSILSIGEGLVSQLPALIISITSGIVITRVTSEARDSNLGSELAAQLLRNHKAAFIASGLFFLIGLVPGFPKVPFFAVSVILLLLGEGLRRRAKRETAALAGRGREVVEGRATITQGGVEEYALTIPVMMETGKAISDAIRKEKGGFIFLEEMIPKMRLALYQDLGVRFPGVHVRTDSPTLAPDEYSVSLNEVPVVRGRVLTGHVLTNETAETLRRYNIPFTTYKNVLGMPSIWVENRYTDILTKAGMKYWSTLEILILHLSYFYRHYAGDFLGIQEVRGILEFVEKSYPDLTKEVTRLIPLQRLTEIFKRLVQEEVSIKDLRTILESLSEWAQTEKDTVLLTEYIRSSLKRYISYKYSQGQSVISVYLLDPEIEDMVRAAIKQTAAGSYLALDPDATQMIIQAMRKTVVPTPPGAPTPVLLTAIDVRRFVRRLIEQEYPDMAVLSFQEIVPELRIQPMGRVQLS